MLIILALAAMAQAATYIVAPQGNDSNPGTIQAPLRSTAASAAKAQPESPPWATKDLRAGVIGTDTSHVPAFADLFRSHPEWRIKVVAAFKGGSPDLPYSADRVEKFAATMRDRYKVELVGSVEELIPKVDVILLQSLDGRVHLAQARPVLAAGRRLFIDKPFAAGVADARRIVEISKATGTPFFSSSASRFGADISRLRDNPGVGKVAKVQGSSPLDKLKGHSDLAFYGIHGVEAMYAVMGPGCVSVSRKRDGGADVTTGKWKDGRLGVYRSPPKDEKPPMVQVWGAEGTTEYVRDPSARTYEGLVRAIAEFFHTGKPPVDAADTVEIVEFMEAAQLSYERGGAEVPLEEVRTSKSEGRK
jgi:predicted dehydrogenase